MPPWPNPPWWWSGQHGSSWRVYLQLSQLHHTLVKWGAQWWEIHWNYNYLPALIEDLIGHELAHLQHGEGFGVVAIITACYIPHNVAWDPQPPVGPGDRDQLKHFPVPWVPDEGGVMMSSYYIMMELWIFGNVDFAMIEHDPILDQPLISMQGVWAINWPTGSSTVMVWPLLFPFLSLPSSPPLFPFISDPIWLCPLTLHLLLHQLWGILMQPYYVHYQTSLGLVLDLVPMPRDSIYIPFIHLSNLSDLLSLPTTGNCLLFLINPFLHVTCLLYIVRLK